MEPQNQQPAQGSQAPPGSQAMAQVVEALSAPGKKLILLHNNADLDALGSAIALSRSFPGCEIGTPDRLSRVAQQLQRVQGVAVVPEPDFAAYSRIFVVDTSTLGRLGLDNVPPERLAVIDHHTTSDPVNAGVVIILPHKRSCAEIVHDILKAAAKAPDRDSAVALLSGIIADTGHFKHANISTLETVIAIMRETGVDLDHAMNAFVNEPEDISEKIAVLKGMQRMKFERVQTWLIAGTCVSSHEALVCNSLLAAGADVSFVAAERGDDARLSGRARSHAVRFGLNLGTLFGEVAKDIGGEGGGHPGAAGLSYRGDAEALLNVCMQKAARWADEKLREAQARAQEKSAARPSK